MQYKQTQDGKFKYLWLDGDYISLGMEWLQPEMTKSHTASGGEVCNIHPINHYLSYGKT